MNGLIHGPGCVKVPTIWAIKISVMSLNKNFQSDSNILVSSEIKKQVGVIAWHLLMYSSDGIQNFKDRGSLLVKAH